MKTLLKSKGVKPFRGKKADLFVEYFFAAMDTWEANYKVWTKDKDYDEISEILEAKAYAFARKLWRQLK